MRRGDYDHNHTSLIGNQTVTTVLIVATIIILGGLAIGLAILSHL